MSQSFKPVLDFASITPQTTKGDLIGRTTVGATRVAVGADNTVLTADSSTAIGMKWASASANLPVFSLTGATTLPATSQIVLVSGTTFAISLPAASGNSGLQYIVQKLDSITTNISISGSGFVGVTLSTVNEQYTIICNGTTFYPLNHFSNTAWTNAGAIGITATGTGPTKGTSIIIDAFWWRRVGPGIEFFLNYQQNNGGAAGTGNYIYALPAGLIGDTGVLKFGDATTPDGRGTHLGEGIVANSTDGLAATVAEFKAYPISATLMAFKRTATNYTLVGQTSGTLTLANSQHNFFCQGFIPILGWGA